MLHVWMSGCVVCFYCEHMDLRAVALLPLRLSVAATQATLGLGQLASAQGPLLRDGGPGQRVIELVNTLAALTAADRPLGKALARNGLLDQLADEDGPFIRLLQTGGPLDRQLGEDGSIYRFLQAGGPLDRLLEPGGPLDRLLADEGAIERMLADGGLIVQLVAEQGILETMLAPGGTLDRLVALGETFDALVPRLEALGAAIPNLNSAVVVLSGAVEPLSSLAGRLPGSRRRGLARPRWSTTRAIKPDR